jgi:protein-tyrosine-phosphatase
MELHHLLNEEHAKRKRAKKSPAQKAVKRKRAAGVLLYPLAPFRPFMVKALQKDGLKITGKGRKQKLNGKPVTLYDVVLLFKKHVIDNQPYTGNFNENIVTELSAGLIQSIIKFIKDLVNKKKRGEKLSPREETLVDAYEKTEDRINEAARGEVNEGIGEFLTNNALYIAIALIALFFLLKKK